MTATRPVGETAPPSGSSRTPTTQQPQFHPLTSPRRHFALALHELATNAAKYGALSNATGRVHVSWSTHASHAPNDFTFRWQEQGGPPVWTPTEKGFGSAVLEQVMAEHFDMPPQIQFAPGGDIYELKGSLGTLVQTNRHPPAEDAHEHA